MLSKETTHFLNGHFTTLAWYVEAIKKKKGFDVICEAVFTKRKELLVAIITSIVDDAFFGGEKIRWEVVFRVAYLTT